MQLTKTNILPYSQVVYADICHWLMIELLKWASSLTSARSQKYLQLLHLVSRQSLMLSTATPLSSLHSQSSCRRRWPVDSNGPSGSRNGPNGFTNCPSGSPNGHIGPQTVPVCPQMVPESHQLVPVGSEMAAVGPQVVPVGPQMALVGLQMVLVGLNMVTKRSKWVTKWS